MSDVLLTTEQIDTLLESQNPTGSKIITETNKKQLLRSLILHLKKRLQH